MEPQLPKAYHTATLVDLLDRVLDKGLFLQADLVISLAGIPLIGATLSLALAGTDTMLKYGVLSDWDEAIRAAPRRQRELLRKRRSGGEVPASQSARATRTPEKT